MHRYSQGLALFLLLAAGGAAHAQQTAPGGPDPMVCAYNTTSPVIAPGATGFVQCDSSGKIIISNPGGGGGGSAADQTGTNASDAQATSTANQHTLAFTYIFNGTTWDRLRGTGGSANVTVGNFPATQSVSGTVAATQSGTWNNNLYIGGAANASGNPAFAQITNFPATQPVSGTVTASNTGFQSIGVYNSTQPTLTSGNTAPIQLDPSGNLRTVVQGGVVGASQSTAAAASGAWPMYLVQGTTAVAATNPTFAQLTAGTAKVGVVTTDQTTHGTTDKVAADLYVGGNAVTPAAPVPLGALNNGTPGTTQPLKTDGANNLSTIIAAGYVNATQNTPATAPYTTAEQGSSASTTGITPNVTTAATSNVGKASQGNLYRAYAVSTTAPAAQQYLVCINATAAPAASAAITPVDFAAFNLATTAGSTASINFGPGPPSAYSTGITCLVSTSLTTFTAGTASNINVSTR